MCDSMTDYLTKYGKGLRYILMNLEFKQVPWFSNSRLSRREICLINRLKTNHAIARKTTYSRKTFSSGTDVMSAERECTLQLNNN